MSPSQDRQICDTSMGAPHVVIIGAGASRAAFPCGDKNGRKLPVMDELVEVCGLKSILDKANCEWKRRNFEDIYSELYNKGSENLLDELERAVFKYFRTLELPDHPTIYDYLAVCLRGKDLIASFNWDPLLWLALTRNSDWAPGPQLAFLHGNTAIGYCIKHRRQGPRGGRCGQCGDLYASAKLLYPIQTKNYASDPYVSESWSILKEFLEHAFVLTVFGYSAPKSDVEAVRLMKEAWGPTENRVLEQVEIIDLKSPEELLETWEPFIFSEHRQTCSCFLDSILARFPRRSCEAKWSAYLMNDPYVPSVLPITRDWAEFKAFFAPLIEAEKKCNR